MIGAVDDGACVVNDDDVAEEVEDMGSPRSNTAIRIFFWWWSEEEDVTFDVVSKPCNTPVAEVPPPTMI